MPLAHAGADRLPHQTTVARKNLGRFVSLPQDFISKVPAAGPNLDRQFKLVDKPALMFRESTAELIHLIDKEGSKDACSTAFVVVSQWFSGIEPYEPSADGSKYYQPDLARKLLESIVAWNPSALEKLPSLGSSGQTVANVAASGIAGAVPAHDAFEDVVKSILAAKDRPPVLIALDQFNALFRKTEYCNAKSQPIMSNEFAVAMVFHNILAELGQPKTAILGAVDKTESLVNSYYLQNLLQKLPAVNKTAGKALDQPAVVDLASRDEFEVILPPSINPVHNDAFAEQFKQTPKHISRVHIPEYSHSEVGQVLHFYSQNNVLYKEVSDRLVAKWWMISQGNPLDVFKSCISL
nr:hypothetical protein HK105_004195 [Polyrhizophydium stewartii]